MVVPVLVARPVVPLRLLGLAEALGMVDGALVGLSQDTDQVPCGV